MIRWARSFNQRPDGWCYPQRDQEFTDASEPFYSGAKTELMQFQAQPRPHSVALVTEGAISSESVARPRSTSQLDKVRSRWRQGAAGLQATATALAFLRPRAPHAPSAGRDRSCQHREKTRHSLVDYGGAIRAQNRSFAEKGQKTPFSPDPIKEARSD